MTSYTDIFGGAVIQTAERSLNKIDLNQNLELSWLTQFQDSQLIVAMILDVDPTANGFFLKLPDATLTSVGQSILINNVGSHGNHPFILKDNAGNDLINPFNNSNSWFLYLFGNTTNAGNWRVVQWGGGNTSVTSVGIAVPDATNALNLVVTGSPITASGVIDFALGQDLLALVGFGNNTGMAVRTVGGVNPVWKLGSILGTAFQIVVGAIDVNGNQTVSLPGTITGINNLTVGQINLSGATIASLGGANVDINLSPIGSGAVVLKGDALNSTVLKFEHVDSGFFNSFKAGNLTGNLATLSWPATDPLPAQVMRIGLDGTSFEWSSAPSVPGLTGINQVPRYISPAGALGTTLVEINDTNDMTKVKSISVSENPLLNGLAIGVSGPDTFSSYNNGNMRLEPNGTGRALASGIAFAWIRCDATLLPGAGAILSSFNVLSVVRAGPGNYTVNFSNNFTDVKYCGVSTVYYDGAFLSVISSSAIASNVGFSSVLTFDKDGTLTDAKGFSAVFYQPLV